PPIGLPLEPAEDRNGAEAVGRRAAEIVRQPEIDFAPLTLTGAAEQLIVNFVRHAQAGSADRMSEALQPAVDLAGQLATAVVFAVENIERRAALVGQA